jgi:c-di-GMP-binding flagellar brake protein YcgR
MFRPGKVLKVKVELTPDLVGFGRVTVIEERSNRLFLELRTGKGEKKSLPRGAKIWFVSDVGEMPFNGLWSTTILNSRVVKGKTALECASPKFEAHIQRRKMKRVAVTWTMNLHGDEYDQLEVAARNVSRTGIAAEVYEDWTQLFTVGHNLDFTLETPSGPIETTGRLVQVRFNWLANKTDIGLEFVNLSQQATQLLDEVLKTTAGQRDLAPAGKDVSSAAGRITGWLKQGKENVSFVKTAESKLRELISEQDLEELDSADDSEPA